MFIITCFSPAILQEAEVWHWIEWDERVGVLAKSPSPDAGLWLVKEWLVPPLGRVYSFASRKRVSWGNNFTSNKDLFGSSWVMSLLGKVLSNLNSSHGNPLDATKSKTICSLLLARKRRSRNSPLGVRIRSLLTGSASSSFGSGGRACSKESRIAYEGQKPGVRLCDGWDCGEWGERLEKSCCLLETHQKVIAHLLTKPNAWTVESYFSFS